MNTNLESLKPAAIWKNFQLLCSVPHPSNHEEKIQELMMNWLQKLGYKPLKDEAGNIIVSKPATPGMENRKGVIMQAHLDMVPQANSDSKHNFETDPITAYIDGEWVTADGTTLGADNGIGVAAIMAVLESKDVVHGPIEALFTATEETGMDGANGLKAGLLKGDILLNMDSEDEGELYVGCAGGVDANISFNYGMEPAGGDAFNVAIKGLKGGHSGMDIVLGRGNANKIFFRFLQKAQAFGVRLASINGGSLRNAIPREAFATLVVPAEKAADFKALVEKFSKTIKAEFAATEPDFQFTVEAGKADQVMKLDDQHKLVNLVRSLPNGVMRMSDDMKGLVETSTNLAIVKSDNGVVHIACLLRSSVDSAKESLGDMMVSICELAGVKIELSGAYPGWKPNMASPILKTMQDVYKQKWGKVPEIKAVHAGLECGILGAAYPNWDMISFGPTIRYPHSPDEKVNIASVDKFWEFLLLTLANVK
ncbi:MAG: aminoacyl-histidine dipeptidase [Bacteroidales bacterium]|jgi:dipeptidase D|nr:aminoacyl-histidine dipeptidase [Bacteroidales bacterium]